MEWELLWKQWGKSDPLAAMEFLQSHDWRNWDPAAIRSARRKAVGEWAERNPRAAAAYLEANDLLRPDDRSNLYGLIQGWSLYDPEAAAGWLFERGLGGEGEYLSLIQGITRAGGQQGLHEWFEEIKATTSSGDLSGLGGLICKRRFIVEPEAALDWLGRQLDEPWASETHLAHSLIPALAQARPELVADWTLQQNRPDALGAALWSWSAADVAAAFDWLGRNPEAPLLQDKHYIALMGRFHAADPEAARRFVGSVASGPLREALLKAFQSR